MAEEKFKLPGSSYEEVVKIIKGYGNLSKPASLDEVSKLTALHKTIVSRNAGFLIEIGVLDTGAKKAITEPGRTLARALEHEMPDEISKGWLDRVQATDFLTNILTSIRIRKGMTEETLTSHIAYSAGQPRKAGHMTGSRTIIDILRAAGCIKESDGKIIAPDSTEPLSGPDSTTYDSSEADNVTDQGETGLAGEKNVQSVAQTVLQTPDATVRINIDIKVECKPEDLEELGPKLRKMLDSIKESSQNSENNT